MKFLASGQKFIFNLIVLISMVILINRSYAQQVNRDFIDVVHDWKQDTTSRPDKEMQIGKNYLSILPIVGYGPAFGFLAGGAVSITKLLGKAPTKASSALANFQVTTKKQFILNVRSKLYLDQNKWFLQGDWRLLLYNQPTYGIGINRTEADKGLPNMPVEGISEIIAEPMRFKQIRFFEEAARQIGNSDFYAGLGIEIDQYYNIDDQLLDTVSTSANYFITSHYSYSGENGFNPKKYGTNGIKVSVLTDTRDNIANAYSGYYASISLLNYLKIGNNSTQSTQLQYDGRYYLGVNRDRKRQVLAFWSFGSFLLAGEIPYLAIPSIGWDTYNRSGRGHIQGRYRGISMLYNEAEYRFPVSKNNLFGGTLFVNATNLSSKTQDLFARTAIGYGLGIRMQVDKLARTNLTVDFGMSGREFGGIYFNLQESF
jgi:hypothetical protein